MKPLMCIFLIASAIYILGLVQENQAATATVQTLVQRITAIQAQLEEKEEVITSLQESEQNKQAALEAVITERDRLLKEQQNLIKEIENLNHTLGVEYKARENAEISYRSLVDQTRQVEADQTTCQVEQQPAAPVGFQYMQNWTRQNPFGFIAGTSLILAVSTVYLAQPRGNRMRSKKAEYMKWVLMPRERGRHGRGAYSDYTEYERNMGVKKGSESERGCRPCSDPSEYERNMGAKKGSKSERGCRRCSDPSE